MIAFRKLSTLTVFAASVLLSACASTGHVNLQEVRDFADASARLGGYAELSSRYRDTYLREQPYLSPAAERLAKENDAKRRAIYGDFISVQKAVVLYMQTLSMLAGDARYDLSPQIDDLGSGLKSLADTGLEKKHVAAYTGLTRMLTRAVTTAYQGRSVETMVRDGDADVQVLLEGMLTLTRLYAKTHENEKKTVLGMFDAEIPLATRPQDRMLVTLAKAHQMNKAQEYRLIERRYDLAQQGLTKVAQGHQKLRENLDQLTMAEVRQMLATYGRDLRMIRDNLASN